MAQVNFGKRNIKQINFGKKEIIEVHKGANQLLYQKAEKIYKNVITGTTTDDIPFEIKINNVKYKITPKNNKFKFGTDETLTNLKGCFSSCKTIETLNLTKLDVSLVTTMVSMFEYCSALISINGLETWNVSNVTNMLYMFHDCMKLTSIKGLENWDISSVTNMGCMFSYCRELTSLEPLSSWDVSNVTYMYEIFANCKKISSLEPLSSWDVSNVTDMSGMFHGCADILTSLEPLSSWDVSNVTDMNGIFSNCYKLTSLEPISSWDVSNVTNMHDMFYGCESLTSLKPLSSWDVSNVTNMLGIFSNCYKLTSLEPLSSWDVSNVTDMGDMFYTCIGLTSVKGLENWDISSVTSMYGMFNNCGKLTSIDFSNWNVALVIDMSYMFYGTKLNTITCKNSFKLKCLEKNIFFDFTNINWIITDFIPISLELKAPTKIFATTTNVQLNVIYNYRDSDYRKYVEKFTIESETFEPNETDNEKTITLSYSYNGLTATTTVIQYKQGFIPYAEGTTSDNEPFDIFVNNEYITIIPVDNKFKYEIDDELISFGIFDTNNVVTLDLSNLDTSKLVDTNYSFANNSALKSIDLSNWDTSNIEIMEFMFWECINLTTIKGISNWNVSNILNMASMFYNCKSLKSIDLSNWDTSNIEYMYYLFAGCSSLETIDISRLDISENTDLYNLFDMGDHWVEETQENINFPGPENIKRIKCKQSFKDYCLENADLVALPETMKEGGTCVWEIVD